MRLVVVGMGYVGIPVAAAFAEAGLQVTGLDVDEERVAALREGVYPIAGDEPGLAALVAATVKGGSFTATTDAGCLANAEAVLICVQTPFDTAAMRPDYRALQSACKTVGAHLQEGVLVVVESTLAPTTMDAVVRPVLEQASSLTAGRDFMLGHCPERVMPGKLLANLRRYDRVLGGVDGATHEAMRALYSRIVAGNLTPTDLLTAEVVKAFENTYRDVEIALANEFARYCDAVGVDLHEVRALVNRVEGRNLHLPGVGVGGHCIPKDTYLLAFGAEGSFRPELMLLARRINDGMPAYVAGRTLEALRAEGVAPEKARVAVLGLSYLPDTDDTRMSPTVPLVAALRGSGCDVIVHDPLAAPTAGLEPVRDLTQVLAGADAVVVATAHSAYRDFGLAALREAMRGRVLVDGRRLFGRSQGEAAGLRYVGVGEGGRPVTAGP